jgi:16S rRNA (uracil1498-N3)-methyltransferase
MKVISIRLTRLYVPRESFSDPLILAEKDAHYLLNVLRVSEGHRVETFDGNGGVDRWEVMGAGSKKVTLKHIEHEEKAPYRPVNIRLGLNPLKGGDEETAIRMAAAMEVSQVVPVFFFRSDIPLDDDRVAGRISRWKRLARSEVAVSGGAYLPEIGDPVTFEQFLEKCTCGVLFYEKAEPGAEEMRFKPGDEVSVAVGPEGGLEDWEVELAREKGLAIASMGPWILRAELAGVFAPHWVYSRVEDGPKEHPTL